MVVFTRYRSAKSHECNGVNRIFEVDETTQVTGDIADDGGANTDHGNRYNEAWISFANLFIHHQGARTKKDITSWGKIFNFGR